MPNIKAILWDVDGTLAETERDGHLRAFNQAFDTLGVPWRWNDERYAKLLKIAGGRERLLHDMQSRNDAPSDRHERQALAERVHLRKNMLYAVIAASGALRLRAGVRELLQDCERAAIRVGIVTTTSRSNVEALLAHHLGGKWQEKFAAIICAHDAPKKKPHPQAYQVALEAMQLRPQEAVAIEDAPAGVAAAQAAAVPVIVTRSHYFPAGECTGALAVGPSLGRIDGWHPAADTRGARIDLEQIIRWCAHGSRAR